MRWILLSLACWEVVLVYCHSTGDRTPPPQPPAASLVEDSSEGAILQMTWRRSEHPKQRVRTQDAPPQKSGGKTPDCAVCKVGAPQVRWLWWGSGWAAGGCDLRKDHVPTTNLSQWWTVSRASVQTRDLPLMKTSRSVTCDDGGRYPSSVAASHRSDIHSWIHCLMKITLGSPFSLAWLES